MKHDFSEKTALYRLKELAAALRSEGGCAWDIKQTSASLKPYLIEEAYEVAEAIDSGDPENMKEELGDYLYQAFAHARIAEENGHFSIDDVAETIFKKLIGRHPHVFGEETIASAEGVSYRWEQIKKKEKSHRKSMLEGVPASLPALLKAWRIQQKVSKVGFEWPDVKGALDKLEEELGELRSAALEGGAENMMNEAGDLLFSIVNVLRYLKINPEEALQRTNSKFMKRFAYIEEKAREAGREPADMSLEEMDALWDEAKKQ